MRVSRSASSATRARSTASGRSRSPRTGRSRMLVPSQLPPAVTPYHSMAASASAPATARTSSSDHT